MQLHNLANMVLADQVYSITFATMEFTLHDTASIQKVFPETI